MARQPLGFITDGSGDATTIGSEIPSGAILYAVIVDVGATDDTCDITLSQTINGTVSTILTITDQTVFGIYYPRVVEHDNTGTALTTTTPVVLAGIPKIVVTQGGATKQGSVVLLYTEL
jgi:hypothetical protein